MKEINIPVPYAILFLYDLNCDDVEIPEYVENDLVAYNEYCVTVGTQAEIDGEVKIVFTNSISTLNVDQYKKIFNGVIKTPCKKLAISTSDDEGLLEIDVASISAQVSIWADDISLPSTIVIEAK